MHLVTHARKKMKCKILLVLLFIIRIELSFAGDADNGGTNPPEDSPSSPPIPDRFKLFLQWPNSYCFSGVSDCRDTVPQYFTIKALSAQVLVNRTTHTFEDLTYCDTSYELEDVLINKHKYNLLKYWPDLSTYNYDDSMDLWREQWIQYGSCVTYMKSPQDYISGTLEVAQEHNILQILQSAGIFPDGRAYPVEKIQNAVRKITNKVVDIVCGSDEAGNVFLLEINQCISQDGSQFIDCDNNIEDCDRDPIFPDALFT